MKILYGLTHDLEGQPVVRESRTVKVGIGLAKGKALHVWIDAQGRWCVQSGEEIKRVETLAEAKKEYLAAKKVAPERKYPQRLPYFTFTRVTSDGIFEPDFDAIEQYGSLPTEIDIVFLKDEPFDYSYQMWSASAKQCDGDGINAMRIVSLPAGREQQRAADEAIARGEKYFPISDECRMDGCRYSKPDGDKAPACKPHGRLVFQLVRSPRLGGTAYFDTTGFRSVSQIFSSLHIFRELTGQGDPDQGFVSGIPFKMCLRPYKVNFNGRPGTQYGVSLEYRADNAMALKRDLIAQGVDYRLAAVSSLRMLSAAPAVDITDAIEIVEEVDRSAEEPEENPAAITAEFYSDSPEEDDFSEPGAPDKEPEPPTKAKLKQPQRKSASASGQQSNGHPVAPVAEEQSPIASESFSAEATYLDALRGQEWRCLPGQRDLLLRKIEDFFLAGGTPEEVAGLMLDSCGAESPAMISRDRVPQAAAALYQEIESRMPPVTAGDIPGFDSRSGMLRVK